MANMKVIPLPSGKQLSLVTPTLPVAPWIGGKRNLARRITAILDATPCQTYGEPFVGMGGVFLRPRMRPRMRPKAEVINDRGRDIANLFRILQRHSLPERRPQFLEVLRFSREDFSRMATQLAGIEGRFVRSLNDVEGVRQTFSSLRLERVEK